MLLTVPEAAVCAGTDETTIRRWIHDGTLKAVRVGREWLVGTEKANGECIAHIHVIEEM